MTRFRREWLGVLLICVFPLVAMGAGGAQKVPITIRGRVLTFRHYAAPAGGAAALRKVLLASGDGGWKGFENAIARTMAGWGFDVYGLSTREYLKSFSVGGGLTETEAAEDFGAIAERLAGGDGGRVTLLGWSAGASLAVLAGAREQNKKWLEGVAAISLPKEGELGWRWLDCLAFLPFLKQHGPFFSSLANVPKVAPLPLLIIQSSRDKWVPDQDRDELFAVAIRPRRRVFLHAGGHSFPGARTKFFEELKNGLEWIRGLRDRVPGVEQAGPGQGSPQNR